MVTDSLRQRFDQALRAPHPSSALHALAQALKADGMTQVALYHLFAEYQAKLDPDDPRHDAVVDNLDLIWGGPWAKGHALFEKELTDADIR
jgi:hypothetical protein